MRGEYEKHGDAFSIHPLFSEPFLPEAISFLPEAVSFLPEAVSFSRTYPFSKLEVDQNGQKP